MAYSRGMGDGWLNFKLAISRGTDFIGVSSRAEFWHFLGIAALLNGVVIIPSVFFPPIFLLWLVAGLGTVLPYISLTIRRLRDAGYNPHYAWLHLVPLGGPIVWYMCAQPSTSFLSKSSPTAKTATAPAGKPSVPAQKKQGTEAFECADCGAAVAADSNFCQSCGTSFDSDTVECAYCDAEVPSNANFCPSCGAEFES